MSDLIARGDSQHAKTRTLVSLRRDAAVHLQMIFSITPLVRLGKTLSATKPKAVQNNYTELRNSIRQPHLVYAKEAIR